MQPKSSGYTLLEVLLVLLIISGAGYFLLVQMPRDLNSRNIEITSLRLQEDMRETQQAAISENIWYRIRFYRVTREYMIFKQGTHIRTVKLENGVQFGNNPEELTFTPSGVPSVGLTVILRAGDRERRLIVAPVMGRIRMEILR